jgi:hypothetical protein
MNQSKISMPRCCATCDNYKFVGRMDDDNSPFTDDRGNRLTRTKFGKCSEHSVYVFFDQECNRFTTPEDLIDVRIVQNRVQPLQPFQETLI